MQTFLPYKSFFYSAYVLDMKRLGKQRVETMQIMQALIDPENAPAWIRRHPVTLMWRGYENALMSYQYAICNEWTRRGYNDTCLEKTLALFQSLPRNRRQPRDPHWLGKKKVHSTYRKNLLAKNPEWYSRYRWPENPSLDRYYPEPLEIH